MIDDATLDRRIANLERLQRQRRELVARQKQQLDQAVELADRQIANMKAQREARRQGAAVRRLGVAR